MSKWIGLILAVALSSPTMAHPLDVCPAQAAYNNSHVADIEALDHAALPSEGKDVEDLHRKLCSSYHQQIENLSRVQEGLDLCRDRSADYAAFKAWIEENRLRLSGDSENEGCIHLVF